MRISSIILAGLLLASPSTAQEVKKPLWSGRDGFFVSLDGGTSVVNKLKFAGDELTADILAKGGYRFGRWGFFGQVGYNSWVSLESEEATSPSATNLGLGADVLFFEGRARTSLALGLSIYNTDATGEAAGDTALGTEQSRHTGTATYTSGAIYEVVATHGTNSGTGAIVEYGLFSANAAGTMLCRDTESAINKGASDTLTVTAQLTFS